MQPDKRRDLEIKKSLLDYNFGNALVANHFFFCLILLGANRLICRV